MLLDLRLGVEAGAGVVEIDVPTRVEPCELRPPQLGEQRISGGAWRFHAGAHERVLAGIEPTAIRATPDPP